MTRPPLSLLSLAALFAVLSPARALAHCDSLDGPVVADARAALAAGDVAPALKWVGPKQEPDARDAFRKTLAVRGLGAEAREIADTFFFETLVRLHRETEGAPYTGLKPAGGQPAFIAKVEGSLDSGSIDDFSRLVGEHAASGVTARFRRAAEARKSSAKSVAEGRAYVAAYVELMHYVEGVVAAVHAGEHAHGAAPVPAAGSPAAPPHAH